MTSGVARVGASVATWGYVVAVYVFLYVPMVIMVLFSFHDSTAQTLPYVGFTTQWYSDFAANVDIQDALIFSFQVSLTAVVVAAVFGTLFALLLHNKVVRGRAAVQALLVLPLALPGIVLGISLAIVFREVGLAPGYLTVVLGHATFITPVVMFLVMQRLNTSDRSLEQASMDLGGGRLQTFWHVTLPEIRVAILAACLLGFTLSFDEITITLFLTGLDQTLPVYVWTLLRFGFTPEVNAVFSVIGLGSVALIVGAAIIFNRTTKRAARTAAPAE